MRGLRSQFTILPSLSSATISATAAGILLPQSYFRNRTFALIIRRSCYHHHSPFLLPLPLPRSCYRYHVLVTVTEASFRCSCRLKAGILLPQPL